MATLGNLPIGSKIKVPHSVYGDVIFQVADHNHVGYPSNSTTLITEKIIVLRCVDAKEPNNPISQRASYGNNRYSVSNIDQWLNSSASAGQWYSSRHDYDHAPDNSGVMSGYNDYDQDAGFLNGFSNAFINALQVTPIVVALSTTTTSAGAETFARKVFLPSRAEVFGAAEGDVMEGSVLAIFAGGTASSRKAKISDYGESRSEWGVQRDSYQRWWLRTPYATQPNQDYPHLARNVDEYGSLGGNEVSYGNNGIRPLCNVNSGLFISDSPDTDGCYAINVAASFFAYDGIASSTFGLQIASFTGLTPESVEETEAFTPTLTTLKVPTLPRFYHGGVEYDSAPQYQFTVVSQAELTPADRSSILSWLIGRNAFKPLVFNGFGIEDITYYGVFTGVSTVFVNGRCHGFNLTVTFDSPYARKESTVVTTTSGTHTITINNNSDIVDGYVYPAVDFTGSEISIVNVTDDANRAFVFSGLEATEQMHVDCETKIITSNLSGEKLSKFTSKNWLRLRKGENTLVVVSQGDVTITCPCYVMVGFGG